MSSENIAIRVNNVSKCYHLYEAPRDRLKQFVLPRLRQIAGKARKQYFREFWALKDVSFEVKKGETIGIIGRNGAGKSTLLQILCGTLTPSSGSVEINGRVAALLELGAGFNAEFTGRENVYMNASVLGLSKEEIDARFDDIVTFADIGEFVEQPVKTYSSGMYVRLAFAIIVHVDADILIIDEALSVGDVFFVQKCMRFLRNFMERGTVLFVSHDTGAVVNLCNYAILLQQGSVKMAGSPKEVSEQYLKEQYQAIQGDVSLPARKTVDAPKLDIHDFHDMRRDFINATTLRNDIEIFKFRPDASSFGGGEGAIVQVYLQDQEGKPLAWVVGGEIVRLKLTARLTRDLANLIFGFYVKDRLGQQLFGDNTHLSFIGHPLCGLADEEWVVSFTFRMPSMPVGEYSIDIAMGTGTQNDHAVQHWIHDALTFVSHTSSGHMGLVGIPMLDISAMPI
jgi:lipopolysaccharide transport system ATP-binding protein